MTSSERARLLLEGAGCEVAGIAPRIDAALRPAAQHAPDLAIVNLMLEIDVDGFHTATELARRHNVVILIATGFPDSVIEAQDLEGLACEVVRMPYTDDELLGGVARCFAAAS